MEKKKILIIDDEERFTQLVKLNLEKTGRYEVMTQSKGSLGLATAKSFNPDLILLDILMPDMEGGDVASAMHDDNDTKGIPIVFLTAVAEKKEVKRGGGTIGGYPFIAKPVSVPELVHVIEKEIG